MPETFLRSIALQNSVLPQTEEPLSYFQLCGSVIHKEGLSFCDFKSLWAPLSGGSGDARRHDVAEHRSSALSPSEHTQLYAHP